VAGHAALVPAARAARTWSRRPRRCRGGRAATGTLLLEAKDVTKRFGGLVANNNMSADRAAGEVMALIGPNGAGKSTMFNCISGVRYGHRRQNRVPGRVDRTLARATSPAAA
jgi:ABC-type uncharacterized transport system ATPase subunit